MKRKGITLVHFLVLVLMLGYLFSCVHEPILPSTPPPDGVDTTGVDTIGNPIDSIPPPTDTTTIDTVIKPCDPDTVYFQRDLLPIFISNCAKSGCHNEASAADGVVLTDYNRIKNTGRVRPGDREDSEVYEVLVETDPDKVMPPPPNSLLSPDQIELIGKWIDQGALDLTCGDTTFSGGCDTVDVSYRETISPILSTYCVGCHQGNSPSGGITLSNHSGVRSVAVSGQLYGAVARLSGFSPMPQGGDPLPSCYISQLKSWIDAGSPNN